VTISDTTPGSIIHYTKDGSEPTIDSPAYSGPIMVGTLSAMETIEAVAEASDGQMSEVSSATYSIHAAAAISQGQSQVIANRATAADAACDTGLLAACGHLQWLTKGNHFRCDSQCHHPLHDRRRDAATPVRVPPALRYW
jgi:hypothetical protein